MKSILLTASMLCIASAVNIRGTQAVHPLDLPREPQGKTGIQDSHAFKGIAPSWMQAEMPKITASNPCDGSAETCPPQDIDMHNVDKLMSVGGVDEPDEHPDKFHERSSYEKRPACFNGLWWMQGNPASDDVASFFGSKWQNMVKRGTGHGWPKTFKKEHSKDEAKGAPTEVDGAGSDTVLKYVMQVRVANPNVWTWHKDWKGQAGFKAVRAMGLTYQFECDEKAKKCEIGGTCNIRPRFSTWGAGWLGAAAPMQFWMTLTEDPVAKKAGSKKGIIWQRRSTVFGISKARHTYQFRRIVDDKGKQVAGTWDEYKGQVDAGKIPESFVPFLKEMDQGGEKNTKMKKVLEEVVEGVEISGENLDEAASTKSKDPAATVRFKKTASHSTKVGAQVGACPSGLRAWTGHPSSQKTCKYDGRATNGDKKGKPCADATQTPSGCHCCPEGCLPSWMGCDDK